MSRSFIYHHQDLPVLAKILINDHPDTIKWAFYGQMGAGKTTLIKEMIQYLGSEDAGSSPTFSLVNVYHSIPHGELFHLDLFRIKSLDEAFQAGVYEIIRSQDYAFVEWPELIEEWIGNEWQRIRIDVLSNEVRVLKIER